MRRTISASLIFATLALLLMFTLIARPLTNATAVSPQTVFTNPVSIAINTVPPTPIPATPYPSNVTVSGMTGTTTKVTVVLSSMNISRPADFDLLLVSPTGAKMIIMSDAGSSMAANTTLTLDDGASLFLTGSITTGAWKPTNNGVDDPFPAPAPAGPYQNPGPSGTSTLAIAFNGADPNGVWSLYAVDDIAALDTNQRISGGWGLSIITTGSPATFFSNSTPILGNDIVLAASPYPSTIDVTGMTGIVTDVKLTLNGLAHPRTGDLDVLLVSPNGINLIVMSDAGGGAANNITVTLDDASSTPLPPQNGNVLAPGGTYEATNHSFEADLWPAPATAFTPFNSPFTNTPFKTAFGGFSPNGTWSLYIVDDGAGEAGTIAGGWSLDITTVPYTPPILSCVVPSFSSAGTIGVGSSPTGIARGDFNGDSKLDLVVANQGSNNVSVTLGDGMGNFSAATTYATGTSPYSVAVADFNNDTKQDLAVTNQGGNNVSILLGDGMGAFGAATNFGVGISPISVAVGDFNNDMNSDLAVTNLGGFLAGTVSILLGTGTGTFGPVTNFGVRTQPAFVAVGNFNGDANQDLAVANFGSNNVSILIGTGTGSFTSAPTVNVGTGPVSIAIADFNTDGNSDLAVANYNSNNVSILSGTGFGTFSLSTTISASGTSPISVVAADLNSDAKQDLIFANGGSNDVRVLYGDGAGNLGFGFGTGTFPVGPGPNALVVGDFSSDGKLDFATVNSNANSISVLIGNCNVAKGNRFDINGDRKTDYIVFRPSNSTWYPLNTGSQVLGSSTDKIVPEDYNGDGLIEFAYFRPSTARWVVPGIYNLEFGLSTDIPVPADYDGDQRADIAVYRPSEGAWYIRRSIDNNWMSFLFGTAEDKPVPRDYDGDGKADIAIFRPSAAGWYILRSSDNQVRGVQFGISTDRPVPADYDGDGKTDVAVFRPADSAWYIEKSSDGGFLSYAWGTTGDIPLQGDFDGDGKFDISIFRPSNGYWFIRFSATGALHAQPWGTNGDIPIPSVYIPQ